jgi:hypothetical protein
MTVANNKDIKWFKSLQTDEDGRPKWVFVGVGPNDQLWVNQSEIPYLGDDLWDWAEDHPVPLVLIRRGVVYVDVVMATDLCASTYTRDEMMAFVIAMKEALKGGRDSLEAIRFYHFD